VIFLLHTALRWGGAEIGPRVGLNNTGLFDALVWRFDVSFKLIQRWADAHANLPSRARWIAKADVAPAGVTKRVMRRPSHSGGLFLV